MTRKDVLKEVINIPNKTVALELPTSFGKSFIALELTKHKIKPNKTEHRQIVAFKIGFFCLTETEKPRTAGIA